jgi:hypothetical protein
VTDRDRPDLPHLNLEPSLSLEELSAYGYRNDGSFSYRNFPPYDEVPPSDDGRRARPPRLRLIVGGRGA